MKAEQKKTIKIACAFGFGLLGLILLCGLDFSHTSAEASKTPGFGSFAWRFPLGLAAAVTAVCLGVTLVPKKKGPTVVLWILVGFVALWVFDTVSRS